jgi:hypothetical protein
VWFAILEVVNLIYWSLSGEEIAVFLVVRLIGVFGNDNSEVKDSGESALRHVVPQRDGVAGCEFDTATYGVGKLVDTGGAFASPGAGGGG